MDYAEVAALDAAGGLVLPNDEHIAEHRVREFPRARPEERVTLAFGNLTQPVLVSQLQDANEKIVINALASAVRLYPVVLNVVKAVEAGVIPVLCNLVTRETVIVRQRAAQALQLILNTPNGKTAVIAPGTGTLAVMAAALRDDADVTVRRHLATGVAECSRVVEGSEALVKAEYVKLLTSRAEADEDASVKELCLIALNRCIDVIGGAGLSGALEGGVTVRVCIKLLSHDSDLVKQRAAGNLTSLSFSVAGKSQAISGGAVPLLLNLLKHAIAGIRAAAAGALMGIVTDDAGKEEVLAAGVTNLVACLQDADTLVLTNVLRTLATSAANPRVRALLNTPPVIDAMQKVVQNGTGACRRAAVTAIECVQWHP